MRKARKYTETEKQQVLEDVKNINNVVVVAKKYNIPTATIHTLLRTVPRKKITNDLASENKRLTKELNSKNLEINILKELLKKTVQALS